MARRAPRAHYPAPYAIIDLWVRYGAHGSAAFEAEARSMARAVPLATPRATSCACSCCRTASRPQVARAPGELRHVHVVGAGVMGGDIAAWSALRGFTVTLQDRSAELIEPALKRARELFDKRLKDPAQNAAALGRLTADVGGSGVAAADVVIEAIFENLEAKQALYASLEPQLRPTALLATNTSSIMLEPLAARLANPARLVGLHFFNPVAQMPLIEVVHAAATDPAALNTATAFARRIDKLPLPCRSAPGFMVNRVLTPYMYEAMLAAQEGVPLDDDRSGRGGLRHAGRTDRAHRRGRPRCRRACRRDHRAGAQAPRDPDCAPERAHRGQAPRPQERRRFLCWHEGKAVKARETPPAPADLTDRLILVLVNECVACLREGVVAEADLADAAVIFGTGFAPFRGGPLTYARARGARDVVARLEELASRHGSRFAPDAGWSALSDGGKA